ncbi:transposase [Psychrobacter frigidicola]|uniref:transposase n=1 Tax=Psychrobacter frigidicola TaxID=45611 RepID=UPI001918DEF9|nr:transposase [Psychrobacter frigidicola]
MDESGFEAETVRPYGYAQIGKPCIDSYNWQGKKRTNVIGALYEKVLFALDTFEKNINGDIFYNWCKYTLIPSLKTKCVIVMDNASFHMSEDKAKHCFARVQDESCARVFKDCSIGMVIAYYFYHLIVLT